MPQRSRHFRRSWAVGPTSSRWSRLRCGPPDPCTDPAINSSHARSAGSRRPARRRARGFEVHPPAVEAVARRRRCQSPREAQPVVRQATLRDSAARAGSRNAALRRPGCVRGAPGARQRRLDMDRDGRRSEAGSGCLGAGRPALGRQGLEEADDRWRPVGLAGGAPRARNGVPAWAPARRMVRSARAQRRDRPPSRCRLRPCSHTAKVP